ncbi:MAG: tetratricopeptide repeat protein [Limisphaerales bacterium]
MRGFERSDKYSLLAALGWLELGNALEADAELDKIAPELRAHPIVLKVRWCVYAMFGKWDVALLLARSIQQRQPKDFCGWILESEALDGMGRTQEAWENLLSIAGNFASISTISYLLACYAAKLGYLLAAERWLKTAIEMENTPDMKLKALDEPALAPLWEQFAGAPSHVVENALRND